MATEWLPLKQIDFQEFKYKLIPEATIDRSRTINIHDFCLKWKEHYLWVDKTETNGCIFTQFNIQQNNRDILKQIEQTYETKLVSYLGESTNINDPYNDTEIYYKYDILFKREYPSIIINLY